MSDVMAKLKEIQHRILKREKWTELSLSRPFTYISPLFITIEQKQEKRKDKSHNHF